MQFENYLSLFWFGFNRHLNFVIHFWFVCDIVCGSRGGGVTKNIIFTIAIVLKYPMDNYVFQMVDYGQQ